jgi:hypothetical protein
MRNQHRSSAPAPYSSGGGDFGGSGFAGRRGVDAAGFDAHNVLTFSVNLPTQSYPVDKDDPDFNTAALHFDNEYTDRLRAIPGVLDDRAGVIDSGQRRRRYGEVCGAETRGPTGARG